MLISPGILIECDESIKAMIVKIDKQHNHDFIIENIDDKHALIKADRHEELKELLKKVSLLRPVPKAMELIALTRILKTPSGSPKTALSPSDALEHALDHGLFLSSLGIADLGHPTRNTLGLGVAPSRGMSNCSVISRMHKCTKTRRYRNLTAYTSERGVQHATSPATLSQPQAFCCRTLTTTIFYSLSAGLPSYLSTARHLLQLACTVDTGYPADALGRVELNRRLRIIERLCVVQRPDLDDLALAKGLAVAPHCGTAVAAEVGGDLVAGICFLGDRLGAALGHFELVARHYDVRAVCGAGDLLAIPAMAESLARPCQRLAQANGLLKSLSYGCPPTLPWISPSYLYCTVWTRQKRLYRQDNSTPYLSRRNILRQA